MKRTLDEQIVRMKKLSLIKEDDELGAYVDTSTDNVTDKDAEDKIDVIINTPEFENELSSAISMFAKDLPNQLRLIGVRTGDDDGNLESGGLKADTNDGQVTSASANISSLIGMKFDDAVKPHKMAQLLGTALRRSGVEFDLQSLRNAGEKLSELGRELHRNYFKSMFVGIKPIISEMSEDQMVEFTNKLLLGGILISTVWAIQSIIQTLKSGNDVNTAKYKSRDLFNAIKLNLPRWINSLTKFTVY